MSTQRQFKITGYLKFGCPKKEVKRTGPVPCCGRNPSGAFCSGCGKAAAFAEISVTIDAVSQGDIIDGIRHNLCYLRGGEHVPEEGIDIWYPNTFSPDDNAARALAITCEMIEDAWCFHRHPERKRQATGSFTSAGAAQRASEGSAQWCSHPKPGRAGASD